MSGYRASYTVPIPMGIHPIFGGYEPIPFTAALGQAFSFGWRKELGRKRGHAHVALIKEQRTAGKPARA